MSRVRESVDVDVSAHVAYERLCHFEEYPRFMAGVREVTKISEDLSHWVMDLDGNPAEFDARITGQRTDEMLSWQAIDADGPHLSETVTLQSLSDDRTRIIAELELEAQSLMPSEAYGQASLDRRLKADLDGFKRYIERDAPMTLPGMSATTGHDMPPANPALDDGGILGASRGVGTPRRVDGSPTIGGPAGARIAGGAGSPRSGGGTAPIRRPGRGRAGHGERPGRREEF
jgi:ribosome-associated toxin RatA of RatAB toxin-antitoxin module